MEREVLGAVTPSLEQQGRDGSPRELVSDEQHEPPDGAHRAAESGEERRASYLGFVAHEVRNPLSTALWSAELMAKLSPTDRAGPRGEKLSGMCLRSLQRIRLLIEDHFLLERLTAGGLPSRPEPLGLATVLAEMGARSGAPMVDVSVGEALRVWADRPILERILEAMLASVARQGHAASAAASAEGAEVVLRVVGASPPPDPFALPQKGTPSDPAGRALSLHAVSRAARALGGSLSAAADGFALRLPAPPPGAGD